MTQVTALGKRACADCGGELEWNAAKQVLACPFCGFIPKEQPTVGAGNPAIVEHPLEQALANAGDEKRGYGVESVKVKCQSCHAISVFPAGRAAQRCEFCGSPSIAPYQETKDPISPESILPVRLSDGQVRDIIKQWYATRWFAPNRLKNAALTDTLHGIYLPYWTFDAKVHAAWTAMSGTYYYESQTYVDAQGGRQSRQVQKVRWWPSSGSLEHFFDDDLVPGTAGVRLDLLRKVEPFPTDLLAPYDPSLVRGWTVERYQIDLRKAEQISKEQMDQVIYGLCDAQVPGDTHKDLSVDSDYSGRTFKHILVPVWLVNYTFGARTFQTVVNGHSGAVAGERPTSWVKVFFYIVLPLLIALAVFLLAQR